jgi:hypothetical protein
MRKSGELTLVAAHHDPSGPLATCQCHRPLPPLMVPRGLLQPLVAPCCALLLLTAPQGLSRPFSALSLPFMALCGPLRPFVALCGPLRPFAALCGPLRPFAALCGPLRLLAAPPGPCRLIAACRAPLCSLSKPLTVRRGPSWPFEAL